MKTLKCPACGKVNGLEEKICSRCACNLEKLAMIISMADWYCDQASVRLRAGDGTGALAKARASWDLRHTSRAARLAFLAALLNGDFVAATRWYTRRNGNHLLT